MNEKKQVKSHTQQIDESIRQTSEKETNPINLNNEIKFTENDIDTCPSFGLNFDVEWMTTR